MLIFSIADFSQNAEKVFNAASTDEVIVNNNNGKSYKILPFKNDSKEIKSPKEGKSPLEDIPCIKVNITTQEIVELIRESRAGI